MAGNPCYESIGYDEHERVHGPPASCEVILKWDVHHSLYPYVSIRSSPYQVFLSVYGVYAYEKRKTPVNTRTRP